MVRIRPVNLDPLDSKSIEEGVISGNQVLLPSSPTPKKPKSIWHKERVSASADFYKDTIKSDPKNVQAHINYGCMLFEENDCEGAVKALRVAIALPSMPKRQLSAVLRVKGTAAYEFWKIKTMNDIWNEKAKYSIYIGEAFEDLTKSLSGVTTLNIPELLLEVACVACDIGKWDKSIESLNKLVKSFPNFKRDAVLLKCAIVYNRKKEYKESRNFLNILNDKPPEGFTEDEITFMTARGLELEGKADDARAGFSDVYRLRLKKGNYAAVLNERKIEKWYLIPSVWLEMADKFFHMREFTIASDYYCEAVRRGAKEFDNYWQAAISCHFAFDEERAVSMLEMCYKFDLHNLKIRDLLKQWSSFWVHVVDKEDISATRIQGLYKMRKARRLKNTRNAMAHRLTRWARKRLKKRRAYVYTKMANIAWKTIVKEACRVIANDISSKRFYAAFSKKNIWKVFKNWAMYTSVSKQIKANFLKHMKSNLKLYFDGFYNGVRESKREKEVKIRNSVGKMKNKIAKDCLVAWHEYVNKTITIRSILMNCFNKLISKGFKRWIEYIYINKQREYLTNRDKIRMKSAAKSVQECNDALLLAIKDGNSENIIICEKMLKKAKKIYFQFEESDSDEYEDEWAHSFHHFTKAERELIKRTKAAKIIQRQYRLFYKRRYSRFVKNYTLNFATTRYNAAVKIQALIRGFLGRRKYWKLRCGKAVIKIQAVIRGKRDRKRVKKLKADIVAFWNTIILQDLGVETSINDKLPQKIVSRLEKSFPLSKSQIAHVKAYAPTPRFWMFNKVGSDRDKMKEKHEYSDETEEKDIFENSDLSKTFISHSSNGGMYMIDQNGPVITNEQRMRNKIIEKLKGLTKNSSLEARKRKKKRELEEKKRLLEEKRKQKLRDREEMQKMIDSNRKLPPPPSITASRGNTGNLESIQEGKQLKSNNFVRNNNVKNNIKNNDNLFPENTKPQTKSNFKINSRLSSTLPPVTPNKLPVTPISRSKSSSSFSRPSTFSDYIELSGTPYDFPNGEMLPGAKLLIKDWKDKHNSTNNKVLITPSIDYDYSIYGKPRPSAKKAVSALELLAMSTKDRFLVESLANLELNLLKKNMMKK